MSYNIHNIDLTTNEREYELECPSCHKLFLARRSVILAAINHQQACTYCCKECAFDGRRLSKERLSAKALEFYFRTGKIPTYKEFSFNSSVRRVFGGWRKLLVYCGLDFRVDEVKAHANTWQRQRSRHKRIKLELLESLGGCCLKCGYNGNWTCLSFHHKDSSLKTMSMDGRSLANCSRERIDKELENCELLCVRCHMEEHNPHGFEW